ncbi:MAG TPA: UPF0280 family protein [Spirochaetota bacterium]|nr:UPF0280 family protein [Syntrophorhabdaceae bacterium]MDD2562209.1 UPF0280 family protein [Eubacteriales bacterium]MDD4196526.1 UPF0280 family protein [Syntrophorhabdaceae bacterium]HQL83987.1 UPF0280 family protein [Spirochaetota bacterium]
MNKKLTNYQERFYRNISRPADLVCYEVQYKETDLFCCTGHDLSSFIKERVLAYRYQLEEYIKINPLFRESLVPVNDDMVAPPIVREMVRASAAIGIGPMATVAGAISEYIGRDIEGLTRDFIIENGGDIYLRTSVERTIQVHAGTSPFSEHIGIKLPRSAGSRGVCTSSGSVGHSLSFGKADAVCILGRSALFADGLATYLGNIVKKKDDIARAIEEGQKFPDITAILIILGDQLGVWGDLDMVEV